VLVFYDPLNNPYTRTPTFVSSIELRYNIIVQSATGTWKVKVVNGTQESSLFTFTVSPGGGAQLMGVVHQRASGHHGEQQRPVHSDCTVQRRYLASRYPDLEREFQRYDHIIVRSFERRQCQQRHHRNGVGQLHSGRHHEDYERRRHHRQCRLWRRHADDPCPSEWQFRGWA
jgi:hypothetical protein